MVTEAREPAVVIPAIDIAHAVIGILQMSRTTAAQGAITIVVVGVLERDQYLLTMIDIIDLAAGPDVMKMILPESEVHAVTVTAAESEHRAQRANRPHPSPLRTSETGEPSSCNNSLLD